MLKKEQHTAAEIVNTASASLGNAVLFVLQNSHATVSEIKIPQNVIYYASKQSVLASVCRGLKICQPNIIHNIIKAQWKNQYIIIN